MPYFFESQKIKLPRKLDRRYRLTEADELRIRGLHKDGLGIREIAREYGAKCSRRLVQFVIFPERRERANAIFKENRKDGRYKETKEHRAETQRKYRALKYARLKQ